LCYLLIFVNSRVTWPLVGFFAELAVQPSIFNSVFRQGRSGKVFVRKDNISVAATASDLRELGISRGLSRLIIASRQFEKSKSNCLDSALMANEEGRQFVERRS